MERRTITATTSSKNPSNSRFHATVLRCLGIDPEKLTFKFPGPPLPLTDVHGEVVKTILALKL